MEGSKMEGRVGWHEEQWGRMKRNGVKWDGMEEGGMKWNGREWSGVEHSVEKLNEENVMESWENESIEAVWKWVELLTP